MTGPKRLSMALDFLSCAFAWICGAMVLVVFVWILGDTLITGVGQLSPSFIFEDPRDAGRAGGIRSLLVSTCLLGLVCMASCVPLGLATAILLAEFTRRESRYSRFVRRSLDVLAGVPSIVFGLFGSAFFCVTLGMGYSILSGGLTLSCMVLPYFIRLSEDGIRKVPTEFRRGAAALGMSRTTTLFRVILPAALPSIVAAGVLSIGRAAAETAALIFTSGYVTRMPSSLMDSGRSVSVHIYDMAMNVVGGNENACASAAVLILLLLMINLFVNALMGKRSANQVRRISF